MELRDEVTHHLEGRVAVEVQVVHYSQEEVETMAQATPTVTPHPHASAHSRAHCDTGSHGFPNAHTGAYRHTGAPSHLSGHGLRPRQRRRHRLRPACPDTAPSPQRGFRL